MQTLQGTTVLHFKSWVACSAGGGGSGLVQDIAIDPTNASVLYAVSGTQDVIKSVDGGATSTSHLASTSPAQLVAVAVVSGPPPMVFAAGYAGVVRSADGGMTWAPANKGMRNTWVLSLAADPSTPGPALRRHVLEQRLRPRLRTVQLRRL